MQVKWPFQIKIIQAFGTFESGREKSVDHTGHLLHFTKTARN